MCECRQQIKEIMSAHRRCNVLVTDYCGMRYPEIIASPDPVPAIVVEPLKTEEVRPPTEAPEAVPECAEPCVDETSGGESDPAESEADDADDVDLGSCVNEAELADREAQEVALREQIARLELDKMRLKRRKKD